MLFILVNSIIVIYDWIHLAVVTSCDVTSWEISEFLINYQAGYVRRGLLGELMYHISYTWHLDPRFLIVPICVASCVVFLGVWGYVAHREKCYLWCIPTFYGVFNADMMRKDYLILLCFVGVLLLYKKIQHLHLRMGAIILLMGVTLNLHECIFFILYPLMFLLIFFDTNFKMSLPWKVFYAFWLIVLLVPVFIFKGDENVAKTICHSWRFIYPDEYANISRNSIWSLGWSFAFAVKLHFRSNFYYAGIVLRPLAWLVIFVLLTRGSTLFALRFGGGIHAGKVIFFALFQFAALLPMFTVMSCDFGRIVFYWTASTVLAYSFLKESVFTLPPLLPMERICRVLDTKMKKNQSLTTILAVVAMFSIPALGNDLSHYLAPFVRLMIECWS